MTPNKDNTNYPPGYSEKEIVYNKKIILGNNIRMLRKAYGMSQEDFAYRINIRRASIGCYENGDATPPLVKLIKICNFFKISLDTLIFGDFEILIRQK